MVGSPMNVNKPTIPRIINTNSDLIWRNIQPKIDHTYFNASVNGVDSTTQILQRKKL